MTCPQKSKVNLWYDQAIRPKIQEQGNLHTILIVIFLAIVKSQGQPRCPSMALGKDNVAYVHNGILLHH